MKERKLEKSLVRHLEQRLPRAVLWHIHDETTGGQPDMEVAWRMHTSKFEFKKLETDEQTVHDKWEDERQLITLVRYEEVTSRAWVVCWRTGRKVSSEATIIYRPTVLLNRGLPKPELVHPTTPSLGLMHSLWSHGAVLTPGISHALVQRIILETHK